MADQARALVEELLTDYPDDPRLQELSTLLNDPNYVAQPEDIPPDEDPDLPPAEAELEMIQRQMMGGR
jgi:hypothetical protein